MAFEWYKFTLSAFFLTTDILATEMTVFGVNQFDRVLDWIHAAAMGDTLGILFVIVGLMVICGSSMNSLKLLLLISFLWVVSPISGRMISRLRVTTNRNLIDLPVIGVGEQPGKKGESE